jgi:hypothetical protein
MSILGRLLRNPQEVNFFLFLALFALVIGTIYWFASYEVAGTVLLLAFGLATGLIGLRLAATPAAARARRLGRVAAPPTIADVDRPFEDEAGRLPGETFAPFAVGLGVAIATTGTIFGLATVVVGLIPLGWGAWTWLLRSSAELEATEEADDAVEAGRAATAVRDDGRPVEATPGRAAADR